MRESLIIDVLEATKGVVDFKSRIETVLKMLRELTGFDAVGIRISDYNGDYPYFVCEGFAEEFIAREKHLCDACDEREDGELPCLCGQVINGPKPSIQQLFTEGGSFCTNSLNVSVSRDLSHIDNISLRGVCATYGYESMGLFPLPGREGNLGLLQFNHKKPGMLTDERVRELELTARYVATIVDAGLLIKKLKETEAEKDRINAEITRKNELLASFTESISHDLKTPLIAIKGIAKLIERRLTPTPDAQKIGAYAHNIQESADHLEGMIRGLLELAKAGRSIDVRRPVKMEDEFAAAVASMAVLIEEKGLTVKLAKPIPPAMGDPARIRQVMQNLLSNAVKFSASAQNPIITIGSRVDDDKVVYFVEDNGDGIEEKNFARVFGRFERLDPSKEGDGLGLAIVKNLVLSHGGKIWVESEGLGKGARFCFTLG